MFLVLRCCATLALLAAVFANCPGYPWKEWNGHCYRLSASSTTWPEMQHECKSPFKQANIASITSKAENYFIQKDIIGEEPVWLGMYTQDGRFFWTDGSPVNFTYFKDIGRYGDRIGNTVVQLERKTDYWYLLPRYEGSKGHGVCKMASCKCAIGWTERNNQCYKRSKCRRGWLEASMQCRRMAPLASLVTVHNSSDNDFVVKMMAGEPFWIGLNDRERKGQFKWSGSAVNSSVTFMNWAKSKPDGAQHMEKNCVQADKAGTWSDASCHHNLHYICQQPICGNRMAKKRGLMRLNKSKQTKHEQSCARCPPGWSCSRKKCFSKPTSPDTFEGVQKQCRKQHPRATVANISSLVDNDKAFSAAGDSLPLWIAHCVSFKNWQNDALSQTGCTSLQLTGEWLSESCDKIYPGICQIPACVPRCPPGWHSFKGKCYIVNSRDGLNKAQTFCRGAGGHLASILSQEENDFITTLAFPGSRTNSTKKHLRPAFLGAVRGGGGGAPWIWEDCANWTVARWSSNEGDGKTSNKDLCAALLADGRWRSYHRCDKLSLRSVCKMDPCGDYFRPLGRPNCKDIPLCPNDGKAWREVNGTCFLSYVTRPMNYWDAYRACRSLNSNDKFVISLAFLRSEETMSTFRKLAGSRRSLWIRLPRTIRYRHYHKAMELPNRCTRYHTGNDIPTIDRCSMRYSFFCEARLKSS